MAPWKRNCKMSWGVHQASARVVGYGWEMAAVKSR